MFKAGDIIKANQGAYATKIGDISGRLFRVVEYDTTINILILKTPLPIWMSGYFTLATEEDLSTLTELEKEFL